MTELLVGDHLVSSRGIYTHHGLYAGDDQVIHYAGFSNGWQRGRVEQVRLAAFQAGQGSTVRKYESRTFTREESVIRARARIGEDYYCLMANNCEHFVRWCIMGEHDSPQVTIGSYATNAVLAGIGGTGAVIIVAEVGAVAGLSGSGIMSGLAWMGGMVGGGAVAGLGVAAALPGAASVFVLNATLLKDNAGLDANERDARGIGRIATGVGAAGGTAGGLFAVGAMGTVAGFSGAGIASGLAAIGSATGAGAALSAVGVGGGMMIGGVVVTVAAPVVLAATVGYGAYRGVRWLRAAGWLPGSTPEPRQTPRLHVGLRFRMASVPATPLLPSPPIPRPDP